MRCLVFAAAAATTSAQTQQQQHGGVVAPVAASDGVVSLAAAPSRGSSPSSPPQGGTAAAAVAVAAGAGVGGAANNESGGGLALPHSLSNDILAMLSPEGEQVAFGRVLKVRVGWGMGWEQRTRRGFEHKALLNIVSIHTELNSTTWLPLAALNASAATSSTKCQRDHQLP